MKPNCEACIKAVQEPGGGGGCPGVSAKELEAQELGRSTACVLAMAMCPPSEAQKCPHYREPGQGSQAAPLTLGSPEKPGALGFICSPSTASHRVFLRSCLGRPCSSPGAHYDALPWAPCLALPERGSRGVGKGRGCHTAGQGHLASPSAYPYLCLVSEGQCRLQ